MRVDHPDEGSRRADSRRGRRVGRARRDPESGQAMVEFALILVPLLILVVGIIEFGIGLNYWLDLNRLANQGARWAVVNAWPDCPRQQTSTCTAAAAGASNSLPVYLTSQATAKGLRDSVAVTVCYPDDGDSTTSPGDVGTPVRVQLTSPYRFRLIMKLPVLTLKARATMRIETNKPIQHLGTLSACT